MAQHLHSSKYCTDVTLFSRYFWYLSQWHFPARKNNGAFLYWYFISCSIYHRTITCLYNGDNHFGVTLKDRKKITRIFLLNNIIKCFMYQLALKSNSWHVFTFSKFERRVNAGQEWKKSPNKKMLYHSQCIFFMCEFESNLSMSWQ